MCIQCPVGKYQDEINKNMCKNCSQDYSTDGKGKTARSDCKRKHYNITGLCGYNLSSLFFLGFI